MSPSARWAASPRCAADLASAPISAWPPAHRNIRGKHFGRLLFAKSEFANSSKIRAEARNYGRARAGKCPRGFGHGPGEKREGGGKRVEGRCCTTDALLHVGQKARPDLQKPMDNKEIASAAAAKIGRNLCAARLRTITDGIAFRGELIALLSPRDSLAHVCAGPPPPFSFRISFIRISLIFTAPPPALVARV